MPVMKNIRLLVVEIVAGAALLLVLYGLYDGFIGSFVAIPEATGVYLVLFLVLLVIIDIFLLVYTLTSWERE